MSQSMSDTTDEFYLQIHRRMIESGEWERILRLLSSKLSEHGWVDEMRHRVQERARSMNALSFRAILDDISPPAQASVPPGVRREVVNILRQYVKDQFEK